MICQLTRRFITLGLAGSMALSACGSDGAGSTDSNSASETIDAAADTTPPSPLATEPTTSDSASGSGSDSASAPATDDAGDDSASEGATRTVESVYGSVEVPVDPQRIFTLDEYAGAALLANGVEPIGSFATFRARLPIQLLEDADVDVTESVFGDANLEFIAEIDPDMIVYTDFGLPELNDTLSEIAPTVALPFVAPWRDIVAAIATTAGVDDNGAGTIEQLENRIAARSANAAPAATISLLATGPQFGTFTVGIGGVAASILEAAGYGRPDAELAPPDLGVSLSLSPENLGDHDADHVIQLGGDESFYTVDELQALPTFQALPAVQDGRTSVALGEIWTSSDPFSVFWMIEDLAAIQAGEEPGTIDDVDTRWAAFTELVSG